MKCPRILIIDDQAAILSVFSMALKANQYEVFTATSGKAGLAAAHKYIPDLILCDIHMPGDTDGKSFLKILRNDPQLGTTQIVLMTGNPLLADPREGMELGADDFLLKPITQESLLRCVEARLARARVHWRVEDRFLDDLRNSIRSVLPHEFFTPIAGVVGLAQVLRDEWENLSKQEVAEMLEHLEQSGWRLERTLRNYLSILDLDAACGSADEQPLDPVQTAECIRQTAVDIARRHSRSGDLLIDQIHPVPLQLPASDLKQLITELAENAFSFSARGTFVEIKLSAAGVLTVTDQGRGMQAQEIAQIHAFRQFDRKTHEQQGMGLGLALVMKVLNKYAAQLEVHSVVGEGSRFRLIFS